jgi:hypothetical protein
MTQTGAHGKRDGPPVVGLRGMRMAVSVVVGIPRGGFRTGPSATRELARAYRHQGQHAVDDGVDAEAGGVDEDGIISRPQRRHRALGVTGVASEDLA